MDRAIPGHITGLYLFTIINLLALFHVTLVNGEITVVNIVKNITLATYDDMPALFGSNLPENGISGILVYVHPHNACSPVDTPPKDVHRISTKWIALIAREGCEFAEKILYIQKAGYHVGIVHNHKDDKRLVPMSAGIHGREVRIPSVFVGYDTGMDLANNFDYKKRNILLNVDGNIPLPNYKIYLWPFAIVVGTCFLLMVIFMIFKWCRDRTKRNRSRLSSKHLKKIPIKKFKKGDNYDVCAICLDDYEEGEKLRILPCSHAYHRKCIDPWLTKNRKTCPICKRRVIPGDENESESESDDGGSTTQPTERTPLLRSQAETSGRTSTFDNSGLPEAVRADIRSLRPDDDDDDSDSVSSLQGAEGRTLIQVEDRERIDTSSDSSIGIIDTLPSRTSSSPPRASSSSPSRTNNSSLARATSRESNLSAAQMNSSSPPTSPSREDKTSPSRRRKENSSARSGSASPSDSSGASNQAFFTEEDEVSFNKDIKTSKQSQVV